jgi:hypothetical protein
MAEVSVRTIALTSDLYNKYNIIIMVIVKVLTQFGASLWSIIGNYGSVTGDLSKGYGMFIAQGLLTLISIG